MKQNDRVVLHNAPSVGFGHTAWMIVFQAISTNSFEMKDRDVMSTMQYCDISRIECREHNGTSRVSAMVNGEPVWFESADATLRPSAEAIASISGSGVASSHANAH